MTQDPGLASWLQLALTPGLGSATLRRLLGQFGLPQAILAQPRRELGKLVPPAVVTAFDAPEVAQAVASALDTRSHPPSRPRGQV